MMPRLTPALRPKSSAFTIRHRGAAMMSNSQPVGEGESFPEPVVVMFGRRLPVFGPAKPLHGHVQAAPFRRPLQLGETIGCAEAFNIGNEHRLLFAVIPSAAGERHEIEQAWPERSHLPINRADAMAGSCFPVQNVR